MTSQHGRVPAKVSSDVPIETVYQQRVEQFSAAEKWFARRERMVMNLRVVTFVAAVVLFVAGWNSEHFAWWCSGGIALLGGFVVAVNYHDYVRRQLQRNSLLRQINQQAIARLHRDWAGLPETQITVPPQYRATADDLDLFGHASLFHLLNLAGTLFGKRILRDWLLEPAKPEDIGRRQQAVAELAPYLDLRQTLMLEGRLLADGGNRAESFVDWAEGCPWLLLRPWLLWLCRSLSTSALAIPILTFCGVLPAELGGVAFFAVICLNTLVLASFGGKVHGIFSLLGLRCDEAKQYIRMFALMYSMPASNTELDIVKQDATQLGGGVLQGMRHLNRIAALAKIPHNPLVIFFVYLPLQFGFLYDFHILNLLEIWQTYYGKYVRRWFLALGKFEALNSLAGLAADHPSWTMPEIDPTFDRFEARRLGHPLLPTKTCTTNDVEVGPAGSFLLVSGSNMSGKSTLLRAVGVNTALAQAGAPVCAEQLRMPPVTLATSMRIRDSLEAGVSFYMAELMRLKEIVDLARNGDLPKDRPLLYLLDEILLGTNSKERHIAVSRVLQHLLHHGAIGAISTHDLELATSEELAGVCRCVHFCETLHDSDAEQPMTFDYKLRPGIATTTNALKLLEIVGLDKRSAGPKIY